MATLKHIDSFGKHYDNLLAPIVVLNQKKQLYYKLFSDFLKGT